MKRSSALAAVALLTPLALSACASKAPRPDAQIARAEASLSQAEQAGARQYAGVEFDAARDKLGEARRRADDGDMAPAAMLAEQARVDADLAAARSRHQAADKSADEVRAATAALREESQRQDGQRTPGSTAGDRP
jgi:hypothetical protein